MIIEKILETKDRITKKNITETEKSVKDSKELENVNKKDSNIISKNRIQKWQKFTRKMAHFTIYTIGGFVMFCIITVYSDNEKLTLKKVLMTIAFGSSYAIFDEIHQAFSGRNPRVFDVIIDTLGVITGLIIAIIVIWILNKLINYIYERRKKIND